MLLFKSNTLKNNVPYVDTHDNLNLSALTAIVKDVPDVEADRLPTKSRSHLLSFVQIVSRKTNTVSEEDDGMYNSSSSPTPSS